MGKGAVRKVQEHGWVEDPEAAEDRNGERRKWVGKEYKWKAERKR
jgi:U3 small nucleolar RNA-associated protein 11